MIGIFIPAIYALILIVNALLIDSWPVTLGLLIYGGVGLVGVAVAWWISSAEPTSHGVAVMAQLALIWLIGWPVLLPLAALVIVTHLGEKAVRAWRKWRSRP